MTDIEQDLMIERAAACTVSKRNSKAEDLLHTVNEICAAIAAKKLPVEEAKRSALLVCALIDEYFDKESML